MDDSLLLQVVTPGVSLGLKTAGDGPVVKRPSTFLKISLYVLFARHISTTMVDEGTGNRVSKGARTLAGLDVISVPQILEVIAAAEGP